MHFAPGLRAFARAQADCFNCDFRFGKVNPRPSTDPYSVFRYRPEYPHEVSTRSASWMPSAIDSELPQRDFWGGVAWRDATRDHWP